MLEEKNQLQSGQWGCFTNKSSVAAAVLPSRVLKQKEECNKVFMCPDKTLLLAVRMKLVINKKVKAE